MTVGMTLIHPGCMVGPPGAYRMRIAVSGSHCSGKTTLIDEFLRAHPDFAHEPEPYTVLVQDYGEEFSSEPCTDDFYRQLEFNVDRLGRYPAGSPVIYERSPVDFLAYILALRDLNREHVNPSVVETVLGMVLESMRNLDLIVLLPLEDADGIDFPDAEDRDLRTAVDSRLASILGDDDFGVVSSVCIKVVEGRGSTAQRLRMVEHAMESLLDI
jgi:AAA domain